MIDEEALGELVAGSGVSVNADDVEAVLRSLERIQRAAATLLHAPSFDETSEHFYRLLESDAANGGAGR